MHPETIKSKKQQTGTIESFLPISEYLSAKQNDCWGDR
jgi:hypothetical protein